MTDKAPPTCNKKPFSSCSGYEFQICEESIVVNTTTETCTSIFQKRHCKAIDQKNALTGQFGICWIPSETIFLRICTTEYVIPNTWKKKNYFAYSVFSVSWPSKAFICLLSVLLHWNQLCLWGKDILQFSELWQGRNATAKLCSVCFHKLMINF